ncbi:ABC transporter substrate-binding protein [Pedobacter sp. KLB.chiD]|uniref:ABC transporter substrate-binding protein n=1 Tax=Pedobacter sp. KLB.chiD TaxID=3387402 RepID=UPI00399A481A
MQIIGILLPRSTYYQTIGFDLYEGLCSGLKYQGRSDIKIVTENIGFGAEKQQCYRSAEKLLLEENVSMVIAYIGHRMAQLLRPLFLAANKMLIVLDAGASLPNEWPSVSNIFYHSLHNALGAALAAKQAVMDGLTSGGMVTGYYDGGYLHTHSISKAFEDQGGQIAFNHATGYRLDDFTIEPLKNHLDQYPNSALLSLFSGDFVQWYFDGIKKHFNGQIFPVYLPPFGFEEMMLNETEHPGNRIKGIAAWSKTLDSEQNRIFIKTITDAGKTPNLFSLLSWESTSIVLKVLSLIEEHKKNISKIASGLHSFEFESPRGTIHFDSKTNTSIAPMFHAAIVPNGAGKCEVQIQGTAEDAPSDFKIISAYELNDAMSAWYNSYTCI